MLLLLVMMMMMMWDRVCWSRAWVSEGPSTHWLVWYHRHIWWWAHLWGSFLHLVNHIVSLWCFRLTSIQSILTERYSFIANFSYCDQEVSLWQLASSLSNCAHHGCVVFTSWSVSCWMGMTVRPAAVSEAVNDMIVTWIFKIYSEYAL